MAHQKEKPKKQKPKYNMAQMALYMFRTARRCGSSALIVICVALAALATLYNLLGLFIAPTILQAVQDTVPLQELILLIVMFSGGMLLVGALEGYLNSRISLEKTGFRSHGALQPIGKKASETSYANFGKTSFIELMNRAYREVGNPHMSIEKFWDAFMHTIKNVSGLIIYLILLATLTPWIALLVLMPTTIHFFITRYTSGWDYRNKDAESKITNKLDYLLGASTDRNLGKDIRLFGMGSWITDMFASTMTFYKCFRSGREIQHLLSDLAEVVFTFFRNGVAYIYLIHRVATTDMSAPEFLLFFTAIGGFATLVGGLLGNINDLYTKTLSLSIVREFLEFPEPFTFEEGTPLPLEAGQTYELTLENVSYRYPEAEEDTISNTSLTIKPGENLAIVGLNGAGKTTLIKLLCGLLDPTHGRVLLNGQDIRQYNRRDIYKHFTAVFQEYSLMPVSIAENIAHLPTHEVDHAKVVAAATQAGLDGKIVTFDKGYETNLTKVIYENGIELSGGEMQKLLLARAIYKESPIIILDEPTAALDPIAEKETYEQYHAITDGRTSIYISHRLASTRFCDRVILLENGRILEEGSHQTLVDQNGKYAELYALQSHYYKD